MGSLRVARTGLAVLVVLGVIAVLAPVASANPIATVDMYIVVVLILLVLLNYPVNGLMLYGFYRLTRGTHGPHRLRGELISVFTFSSAVLLFTFLGALIDYLVWMGYYLGPPELILEAAGGLIAIGATCYIVCSRYFGMARGEAIPASIVVILVNLLSWGYLSGVNLAFFAYTCIPVVTVGWIVLEVLLVLDVAKHRGHFAAGAPRAMPVAPDGGQVLRPRYALPLAPEKERGFRKELLWANVVMMIVLLVISLVQIALGFWE